MYRAKQNTTKIPSTVKVNFIKCFSFTALKAPE